MTLSPSDAAWSTSREDNSVLLSGGRLEQGQTLSLDVEAGGFVPAGSYDVSFETVNTDGVVETASATWGVQVNYLLQIYASFLSLQALGPFLLLSVFLLGLAAAVTYVWLRWGPRGHVDHARRVVRFILLPVVAILVAAFIVGGFFPALALSLPQWMKCARECGTPPAANGCTLAGPTIVPGSTRAVLTVSRTYRLEMDVHWDTCCYNDCWVVWWDHLKVGTTQTVVLGTPYVVPPSRPVGVANTVAAQRANMFDLTTLTAPTVSC